MSRRNSVVALAVAAVVLLVLAFILSRSSADASSSPDAGPSSSAPARSARKAPLVFPRDRARLAAATHTAPAQPTPDDKPRLDAMQRALFGPGNKGAIFVEANAIRHAPLMEKILRCRQADSADGLARMKAELGIDPMEDIDRVGFDGDVFVASGFFDKLKLPPEIGDGDAYGDGGRLWQVKDDKGKDMWFGEVGDGMLLTASDEALLKSAMDRAEGRGAVAVSGLPAGFGEGEVYGTVGAAFLKSVLGGSQDPVAQTIATMVTSSTVRMNLDEDAALSLDLQAVDEKSGDDLAKAVGGVLAGLHAKAQQQGDAELAQLLEQARVSPLPGGRFNLDVAVPGDTLLRGMGCGPDGTPLGAPPAPPASAPPAPPAPAPQ